MLKKLLVQLQYILPQHLFSELIGKLAEAKTPWLKNMLIRQFLSLYTVNMSEAEQEDPYRYATFNNFFIRKLKPNVRPIDPNPRHIISPVDGMLTHYGTINAGQILQAKNYYFDLKQLLANHHTQTHFESGDAAIFYLAPTQYHRVHMPLSGKLIESVYVPGKLFSVNRMTSEIVPKLYSRNERLICFFETQVGIVAVILVGAMIVGSMQMIWMQQPQRAKRITAQPGNNIYLEKGSELGFFKMGSTVILLFPNNTIKWREGLTLNSFVKLGQFLANIVI